MIITRKIQITSPDPKFWEMIRTTDYHCYKMANRAMQQNYLNQFVEENLVDESAFDGMDKETKKASLKEARKRVSALLYKSKDSADLGTTPAYGMSKQNVSYSALSEEYPEISSYIRSALSDRVFKDFKSDFVDVQKGNRTQRSYNRGMPIPFVATSIQNLTEDGFTFCKFPVIFLYGRDASKNKSIVSRIVKTAASVSEAKADKDNRGENEYLLAGSSFQLKGKKLFLLLCVDIPQRDRSLKDEIHAVVDITFKCPIMISSNASSEVISVGNPDRLLSLRIQMDRRLHAMQGKLKWNNGGDGRTQKLTVKDVFNQKEKNIARTTNHVMTKHVINELVRQQAKKVTIRLNREQEIPEAVEKYMIRFWDYSQIIEKLKYKAAIVGMEVTLEEKALPVAD